MDDDTIAISSIVAVIADSAWLYISIKKCHTTWWFLIHESSGSCLVLNNLVAIIKCWVDFLKYYSLVYQG